jgi:tetratricopeptide (TPR) repeat protein
MICGRPGRTLGGAGVAAVLVAAFLPVSPAAAQEPAVREKARATLIEGTKLFAEGRFAAALDKYLAAQAMVPSAKVYFNIGQAYQGMGKQAQALMAFERFVREARDAPPDYIKAAREEVVRLSRKVALVDLSCDVDGAEVLLDGTVMGVTPLPSRLAADAGRHALTVRSGQFGSQSKPFTALAGKSLDVDLRFRPPGANVTPGPVTPPAIREPAGRLSGAEQAETLIREATALRRAGKDAQAYPLLQTAYRAETTPRTAAQLGLVEMQLGYWLLAEQHLTEALASPRDPWVWTNRSTLETSLGRAKAAIGELIVTGSPPGAMVVVNGKEAGALPLSEPIRLGEGPANVEVRSPGYEPGVRSLSVVGGRREKITLALVRKGTAGSDVGPQVTAVPDQTVAAERGRFASLARPLAWTAGAAALGAMSLGVYGTVRHQQKLDEFDTYLASDHPPDVRASCGAELERRGGPGCDAIYSDMQSARKLAIGGYVAGGLLAAGAVTLFLLSPSRGPTEVSVACGPSLAPGAVCRVAF